MGKILKKALIENPEKVFMLDAGLVTCFWAFWFTAFFLWRRTLGYKRYKKFSKLFNATVNSLFTFLEDTAEKVIIFIDKTKKNLSARKEEI